MSETAVTTEKVPLAQYSMDIFLGDTHYKVEYDVSNNLDTANGPMYHLKPEVLKIINEETYEDIDLDTAEALPVMKKFEQEYALLNPPELIEEADQESEDEVENSQQ